MEEHLKVKERLKVDERLKVEERLGKVREWKERLELEHLGEVK